MDQSQFILKPVQRADIPFIIEAMRVGEGYENSSSEDDDDNDNEDMIDMVSGYIDSRTKFCHVIHLVNTGKLVGYLLAEIRNRLEDTFEDHSIIDQLNVDLFPSDGQFCEIFDLWVDPQYRRMGLATFLKKNVESVVQKRGCYSIYTHTELSNHHVLQLNENLGYRPVRSGPIWDEIIRVSLMKNLAW